MNTQKSHVTVRERTMSKRTQKFGLLRSLCWGDRVTEPLNDQVSELLAERDILLSAARKTLAFIDDLSKSNPGFLGKLVLQDYAQYNEAMIELPAAINKAEGAEGQ